MANARWCVGWPIRPVAGGVGNVAIHPNWFSNNVVGQLSGVRLSYEQSFNTAFVRYASRLRHYEQVRRRHIRCHRRRRPTQSFNRGIAGAQTRHSGGIVVMSSNVGSRVEFQNNVNNAKALYSAGLEGRRWATRVYHNRQAQQPTNVSGCRGCGVGGAGTRGMAITCVIITRPNNEYTATPAHPRLARWAGACRYQCPSIPRG